jgi:hypothetical protein
MKNLVVIGLLLAVSYGAYQVINAPDITATTEGEGQGGLSVLVPSTSGDTAAPAPQWPKLAPSKAFPFDTGQTASAGGAHQPERPPPSSSTIESPTPMLPSAVEVPSFAAPDLAAVDEGRGRDPQIEHPRGAAASGEGVAQQPPAPGTNLVPVEPQPLSPMPIAAQTSPSPPLGSPTAGEGDPAMDSDVAEAAPPGPITIDWDGAVALIESGQYRRALQTLTTYYRAEIPAAEREQLLLWLDALAAKVIYSTEHLFEPQPHVVQTGETLESIGAQWDVPPELIYNINRAKIGDAKALVPGTELKVIIGPFRAEVLVADQQMTLFCRGLYAGRFPLASVSPAMAAGQYKIVGKQAAPGANADSPSQPAAVVALDLGNGLSITTAEAASPGDPGVRMSARDLSDVASILSGGSTIRIQR